VSGKSYTGGIAGYAAGTTTIENCSNKAAITGAGDYTGGIVGQTAGTTTLKNCASQAAVNGDSNDYVGGIAGSVSGNITNCYNTGTISASQYVGGLTGYETLNGSSISESWNTGSVTGTSSRVGGIAGRLGSSSTKITVANCYNLGAITGLSYIGGIAGYDYDNATLANCYNLPAMDSPISGRGKSKVM
jgi:hypothetical protein